MSKKIILDCDPGHDDAVAIMLAAASNEIEILGITCVGGNTPLENTKLNALKICTLIERTDIKIFAFERYFTSLIFLIFNDLGNFFFLKKSYKIL